MAFRRSILPTALATATLAALFGGLLVPIAAQAEPSAASVSKAAAASDVVDKVNPFISTEDDYGQDLPGAEAPNSIVKINPMTMPGRSHSGYDYAQTKIAGFTHTDLDGVGGSGGGGDLLVVPTYVKYTTRPNTDSYAKTFSHDDETATPGYYGVGLTTTKGTDGSISDDTSTGKIRAEATTDVRTGQDRYTFPKAGTASLVVDLRNNFTGRNGAGLTVTTLSDGRVAISGNVAGGFNGYNYNAFYYAETTVPTSAVRTWGASGALGTATRQSGTDIGAILDFAVTDGQQVGLKVAISPISAAQAKIDLGAEMGTRSFDQVRQDTAAAWNALLGRVDVTSTLKSDPDGSFTELFYTHLYRMFGAPVNATSTSGTYRGADGVVRKADGYIHYDGWSLWDDFRKYETLAVTYPDIYHDEVQSLVDLFGSAAAAGKSLSALTQSVPTVRFERAAVVIADAVAKGAKLQGLAQAWPAIVANSTGGYSSADNVSKGYIPDSVDGTLGTAYDDWAMATLAESLGKTSDAKAYRSRATNWTNLYKKNAVTLADGSTTGLIFPKNSSGVFSNANPEQFESGGIYQGTLWQYNWYAADDMGGMIDLMGGKDKALDALKFMFGEQDPTDGSRMLHSNANEIDLQAPYLFNYVGAPSQTQYWVRNIYTKQTWNRYIATGSTNEAPSGGGEFTPPIKTGVFSPSPQGFLPTMDNDAGTMSSTYVAAALGLFPVLAGSNEYQIGTPFFDNVHIAYPTGHDLNITANGVTPDDYYVQSASLNGSSYDKSWIDYDQLTAGGTLAFDMGSAASDWAANGVSSSSLSDVVSTSVYDPASALAMSSSAFGESTSKEGAIDTTINLTTASGTFAGANGDDLAANGAITATHVPAGLTLTAKRTADRTVTLALTGTATSSQALDSVDDLGITVTDAAFSQQPGAGTRAFATKVTFSDPRLTVDRTTLLADKGGAVDVATTLTLGGDSFTGANGRDLVADGDVTLRGLPAGVTATVTRKSATTAQLHLVGNLDGALADFGLDFEDSALTGGHASTLTGDGVSALSDLRLEVDPAWRDQLTALVAEAHYVTKGNYSAATYAAFASARTAAIAALAAADASDDALQFADTALTAAADSLDLTATAYRLLQAEAYDSWSGGDLKTENSTDLSNTGLVDLGGVRPGASIAYSGLDFGGQLPKGISLRYVNNSTRSAPDSAVEVRLDAPDGTLVSTIPLPASGLNWNSYTTLNYQFTDPSLLSGSHTVYFVFRGTTTDSNPWIVNLDWVQFLKTMPTAATPPAATVHLEAEAFTSTSGGALKTEQGTDAAGAALTDVGGSYNNASLTYDGVDLGSAPLSKLTVRYVNNSARVAPNAKLLVYLDTQGSTPFTTVPLPVTGNNWNAYGTTSITVPTAVSGAHKIIVVMQADTTDSFPYVSNLDWFEFAPAMDSGTTPAAATALHIEAEAFASNSGGTLKTEQGTDAAGTTLTDLGGTYDNAVVNYAIDLAGRAATTATVRYVNNSARVGSNLHVDLWLDSRQGDPFATIALPVTGSNWNAYSTATITLPRVITGTHTLIAALRATTTSDHPYAGNFDWFELGYGVDNSALQGAVDGADTFVTQRDRYDTIDYAVFARVLDEGKQVLATSNSTSDDVIEAVRRLSLSTDQLQWRVVTDLNELIAQAKTASSGAYTKASLAALATSLTAAEAVVGGASYGTYTSAIADLTASIGALVVETAPVITTARTRVSYVEGSSPSSSELIAALGATIDKGALSIDTSAVRFGSAGTYTATLNGRADTVDAAPVEVTIVVTAIVPTAASVTLTGASVTYGDSATLTAMVTSAGASASGQVVLTIAGDDYPSTLANGSAQFALPATLPVGAYSATVRYLGSKSVTGGSADATVLVGARFSTIAVAVKNAPSGKPATVTVSVTAGAGAANGIVTVRVAGVDHTVQLSSGRAAITLPSTLPAGKLTVAVTYAGDATTASSTATAQLVIAQATSKVSVSSKTSKPKVGKKSVVTIRVTGITKPAGSIAISVAGKKVKTVTMKSSRKGVITVTLPAFTKAGRTTISVKYAGNASVKSATGSTKVTVRR